FYLDESVSVPAAMLTPVKSVKPPMPASLALLELAEAHRAEILQGHRDTAAAPAPVVPPAAPATKARHDAPRSHRASGRHVRLAQLGYKQELHRRLSGFSNFAVSFSIISILAGCITLYSTAMLNGGPVDIIWGWVFVGGMVIMVSLAMAEVCSVYPTAGGLYW